MRLYLLQRLKKSNGQKQNPFAFGGGYRNGGLSQELSDAISAFASFDYMGAAEYEFGELPKAMGNLFESKREYFELKLKNKPVYVMAPEGKKEDITKALKNLARATRSSEETRDYTGFQANLKGETGYGADTCGWIDLTNNFMFFTDLEMYEGFKNLYENQIKGE
jgi:hypothetical protein